MRTNHKNKSEITILMFDHYVFLSNMAIYIDK